jgi:hypothetical protein
MLNAFSTTIHVPNIATGEQLLEALEVKTSHCLELCIRKELRPEIPQKDPLAKQLSLSSTLS